MTPTLDLADPLVMTSRVRSFHVLHHDEGATTTIFEIDNADHALPMPGDGETYEYLLEEPSAALVTFVAIGDTLRVAHTVIVAHPLADMPCAGSVH